MILEDKSDFVPSQLCPLSLRKRGYVLAAQADRSRIRREHHTRNVEERTLAAAGRPYYRDEFARVHRQVHMVKNRSFRLAVLIALYNIFHLQNSICHWKSPPIICAGSILDTRSIVARLPMMEIRTNAHSTTATCKPSSVNGIVAGSAALIT